MATMRTYGDGCGIAHALDLVGERWALLVVRELLLGPKRFTDLRAGLPNASPNVLSQRLRELEQATIVRRRKLPPPAGSSVYELTDWGRELETVLQMLGLWAMQSPSFPHGAPVGVDSVILAIRTFFDAEAATGLEARFELRLAEHTFHVVIADGRMELGRGPAGAPDTVIATDAGTLSSVLWEGRELDDALRAGDLEITGEPHLAARFVTLFPQARPLAARSVAA
jgi:DNA-binding HxlR family transcriptional regulator